MSPDIRRLPVTADDGGIRPTLADVHRLLRRHKWTIAAVFIFTVLGAYASVSLMTELYEARSALLVKLGRENLDAPPTAENTVLSTGVRREELGSEAQLLHSTDLIAQVVDEIGADTFKPRRVVPSSLFGKAKFYTKAGLRWVKAQVQEALIALDLKKRLNDSEQAIALIQEQLVVEPQKDADVITLRMRLADPALAVRVQHSLIDRYLARRITIRQDAGGREFLERQASDMRDALARAENARNEWKQTRALTVPAEQKSLLLRNIRDLAAEQAKVRAERAALGRETAAAEQLLTTRTETVKAASIETPNPAFQLLHERLAKLEADRAHVLSTYQPEAATVRILDEELASVRSLLARQERTQLGSETSQPNPLRQQLEQRLQDHRVRDQGLAAAEAAQGRQLAALSDELGAVEQADAHLSQLERDRQVAEMTYLAAVERRNKADVEARLDLNRISNVSVASAPAASLEPVYPRKLLIMVVALVLGLALGIALAIGLEWTNDTVRDPEQVEWLTELACLGSVSFDRRPRERMA